LGVRETSEPDVIKAATRMRLNGFSFREIADELGFAKESVSWWLRDLELTQAQQVRAAAAKARREVLSSSAAPVVTYLHPQFVADGSRPGFRHHHTKSKGDAAEAMVLAAFAVHGFVVSRPFSENAPYDLIVDDGTRLAKVQVKHVALHDGYVVMRASSASQYVSRLYSDSECDFFAGWCPDLGTMYLVAHADTGNQGQLALRLTEPRNLQNARFARDYEFAGVLPWPEE
jgi:hypothetical protein